METKEISKFEEFDQIKPTLTDKEVFTKIWTSPREVFEFITEYRYDKYLYPILFLAGVASSLDNASSRDMGEKMGLFPILGITVLLGGLLGWISYYIFAALLSWTGKMFGGKSNTEELFRVGAYASIPSVVGLGITILQVLIFGKAIFLSEYNLGEDMLMNVIFWIFIILGIILGIWNFGIGLVGISVAQKFGLGNAFLNIIAAGAVIIVPLLFIFLMFKIL